MLTPESSQEFTQARQRAFIEEWFSYFAGRSSDLLSFEEVKKQLRLENSAYKGLQEIELAKIVGSTGRYRDFTRTFLPKNNLTSERWQRVDAVAHSETGFPPIEVYQVGEVYFVRDGNHRISVAHTHGAKTIEAYVIEYRTAVSLTHQDDLDDMLLKMERAEFLSDTYLDILRPDQNVHFTEPGRYWLVKEHIAFHKYLRETENGREISYEAAVASWYDYVYLPLVQLIREREVLKYFPDRTEADLYAWLLLHRAALEAEMHAMGQIPDEAIVSDLEKKAADPLSQLIGFFGNRLNLAEMSLKAERAQFLQKTRLDEIRPAHNLVVTEPGSYQILEEHIAFHKFFKNVECGCDFSDDEIVASWYDNAYLPVVQLIREREVLKSNLVKTETEAYIWLTLRRAALEAEMNELGRVQDEEIVGDLIEKDKSGPLSWLTKFFNQRLSLPGIFPHSRSQTEFGNESGEVI